jgi:hypothetical protein
MRSGAPWRWIPTICPPTSTSTTCISTSGGTTKESRCRPVATVAYFDTFKEIGVATEIIGVTEAGEGFVEQMKSGQF